MSNFQAIRDEIQNLMDLLEGHDEDERDEDELDEDDLDDGEDLEEQYRRARKRTVFAGGGTTGSVEKTGRTTTTAELRQAARAARISRKRGKGHTAYTKRLRMLKRLRTQPKFQRIQRRKRQAAIKKGTRQESVILDRLAGLLEELEEATGHEFGIDRNGELFYYDDDE